MSKLARDRDAITQKEFQKLENEEGKKRGFFSRISKKEKVVPVARASPLKPDIQHPSLDDKELTDELYGLNEKFDKLMIEVEKQAGRLEMYDEEKASLAQRISDLASQLGELRSVIVSRERSFDKIESDFGKMQEEVNSISPKSIHKNFEVFESKLIRSESEIEKLNIQHKKTEKTISGFEASMKRIKSYDNLFKMLDKVGHKVSEITATKGYIDRMTAKTESIFSELSEKTQILDSQEERLKANETLIHDIAKDMDKMGILVKDGAKKEDVQRLKKDMDVVKKDVFKKDMEGFMKVFQAAPPERYVTKEIAAKHQAKNAQVTQAVQVKTSQPVSAVKTESVKPEAQSTTQTLTQVSNQSIHHTTAQSVSQATARTVPVKTVSVKPVTRAAAKPAEASATRAVPPSAVKKPDQPGPGFVPPGHEGLYKLKEEVDRMRKQERPKTQSDIHGDYQPLVNFIKAALARGITKEMLKAKLLSVGWKEEIINRHLQ